MRLRLVILTALCLPWFCAAQEPGTEPRPEEPAKPWSSQWFSQQWDRIQVGGSKTVGFHLHEIDGDRQSFNDQNRFGEGARRTTDFTDLSVRGQKLFDVLTFDWRWTNTRFGNPFDQRVTLSYQTKSFGAEVGDITASLGGTSSLAGFQRTMKGISLVAKFGGGSNLQFVTSTTKAAARTITIPGNNSSGPYYLQASQIVDGSERIQVDGLEKRRGEDYRIDYVTGILTFREGMIIPATAAIVVTYETYAFNANAGRIDGMKLTLPFGKGFNFAVTAIQQKSRGSSSLLTRTDQFFGFGNPAAPYDLEFPPLIDAGHPFFLTVDGLPQTIEVDFYFDHVLPNRFYFRRFIPGTSIVKAIYTPRPDPGSGLAGDRRVVGYDFAIPIGRYGGVNLNIADSEATQLGGKIRGTAKTATTNLNIGRLNYSAAYRDIPPTYIAVESVGFQRNERGSQHNATYRFSDFSSLTWSRNQSRVSAFTSGSGSGINVQPADSTIQNWAFNYSKPKSPAITFSRTENRTKSSTSDSKYINDNARVSHEFGRLSVGADIGRTRATTTSALGGNQSTTTYNIDSLRGNATWRPWNNLSFNAVAANSSIIQSGQRSTANESRFSVNYSPWSSLTLDYEISDNDSGFRPINLPSQFGGGFNNGWGYGYNGNGFSGGSPFGGGLTSYAVSGKGQSVRARWTPFTALSVDFQHVRQESAGEFVSNSSAKTTAASATYSPLDWISITGQWAKQSIGFLSGSGSSENDMFFATLQIGPWKRWTLSFDVQQVDTASVIVDGLGERGEIRQKLGSLGGRLEYAINPRQNVFMDWRTSRTQGYQGSRDFFANLGYEYRITENISLIFSGKLRELRNFDPELQRYNYRARTLDAELAFRF